ncbi:MAG: flavodoxin domain-containing protein [Candidatus Bathyarchaeia archaeon]|jgi:menaquinone-dependent protoporphyrinogen oxidase
MNTESKKAILVYATRYGATKSTSEEIAKVLREHSFETRIVNAKEEKVKDLSEYDLVVVGSGMAMGNWVGEAEAFLKEFHSGFEAKKLALFISSLKPVEEKEGKTAIVAKIRKVGLDDKILKYQLKPISVGFFGGILDYNKMGFLTRKAMKTGYKAQLQKHGFKEVESGVYDLRDWDEIRSWATELAKKAQN